MTNLKEQYETYKANELANNRKPLAFYYWSNWQTVVRVNKTARVKEV